jgi:hypothetical protein
MHMWHHVTNHLIISNDKDSNSENRIKLHVHDRVGESPLGIRRPSQNILTLYHVVASRGTHRVKPRFLDAQQVIFVVIVEKHMHGRIMPPHID